MAKAKSSYICEGAIVHYVEYNPDASGRSIFPAMVIAVNNDGTLDLEVFGRGHMNEFRRGAAFDRSASPGTWCNPPEPSGYENGAAVTV